MYGYIRQQLRSDISAGAQVHDDIVMATLSILIQWHSIFSQKIKNSAAQAGPQSWRSNLCMHCAKLQCTLCDPDHYRIAS